MNVAINPPMNRAIPTMASFTEICNILPHPEIQNAYPVNLLSDFRCVSEYAITPIQVLITSNY